MTIAGLFPSARVLGIDYHDASIAHCRAAAPRRDAGNVRFEVASASGLPGHGYDLMTFFDSLHDIGDPLGALTRARQALSTLACALTRFWTGRRRRRTRRGRRLGHRDRKLGDETERARKTVSAGA